MAQNNIIAFNTSPRDNRVPGTEKNKKIIAECRRILQQHLPQCFSFFPQLDDSLFKLAEQSRNNQQQEEYFVAMRRFRVEQDNIKQSYTQLVLTDYDAFWSSATSSTSTVEDNEDLELSLLQNEILEEKIALDNIVARADKTCGKALQQLEQRFSQLRGDTISRSPLSFRQLAEHLQTAIQPAVKDLDIVIKLLAYKQFEQHAIPELERLIQQLNDTLIKHHILPDLDKKKRKQRSPSHTTSQSAYDSDNTSDYIEEDPALFDELRRLLGRSSAEGAAVTQPAAPHAEVVALNTLVSVLSSLQQQQIETQPRLDTHGELIIPDLRQTLHASLGQEKAVRQIDEDTINVISLLFEFILEDRAIPAPIRALLARLQLPMLKVAITDKTFFSKKNHTARRLLNNLAKISTGWDHTNGTEDILYNQIESVVNTILTQFDSDMAIFDSLNAQLNQFMAQQEQHRELAEQRIAKATEGQEKLELAEQTVEQTINDLMAKYSPVPKAVVDLVNEGWKKVLRLRLLQKGQDSQDWHEAVMHLEQLLWSVTPKNTAEDRKKLIDTIPGLLRTLRTELSGASFNQHKITALFNELKACHIQCLNGNQLDKAQLMEIDQKETISTQQPEVLGDIPPERKAMSDEQAMQLAKSLQVGTWLEKKSEDGQTQRIKFSWRSNLTGRCLFVTYQGLKAADVTLSELAGWFQQGLVEIIDNADQPLVDRALTSLRQSMQTQGSTPS